MSRRNTNQPEYGTELVSEARNGPEAVSGRGELLAARKRIAAAQKKRWAKQKRAAKREATS